MQNQSDIDLPLLPKSSISPHNQNQNSLQSSHKFPHNSHFTHVFDPSTPPTKFTQYIPFLKRFFFLDMLPYVKKINRTSEADFSISDIPKPYKDFNIEAKIITLDHNWSQERLKPEPSFLRALYKTFFIELLIPTILDFVDTTARLCYSVYLGRIISLITSSSRGDVFSSSELFSSSFILCCLIIISYFAANQEWFLAITNSGKVRLTITSLLYKKLNSISLTSLHEFKIGKVVNLIANDLNDIDTGACYLPPMFSCPYMIILGTGIVWNYFGPFCLIGLAFSTLFVIAQINISNRTQEPRDQNKLLTDDRVKYTNEIIENIRLIKMYAWEKPFKKNIEDLRVKEADTFRKIIKIDVLGKSLSIISSYLSILLMCSVYTAFGGVLRMFFVNFKLIVKRVQDIMLIEDVLSFDKQIMGMGSSQSKEVIFKNYTAYWHKNGQAPCLSNINLSLQPGTLTTVIGKIGSGKTTLLFSFLRELPLTKGILSFSGKVAYVEQEPIIFSGTIKENILFGKDYEKSLYEKVLRACCLEKDLTLFSHRDQTLIGERGVNLSGGQKTRISLARAIYSQSDIYLLDDPLAAVDSKVARRLFENALKGELLRDKIVLLVTHHLNFARESDYLVVMEKGRIQAQGTFQEISLIDTEFLKIFKEHHQQSLSRKASPVPEIERRRSSVIEETKEAEKEMAEESTTVSLNTYKDYLRLIGTYKDFFVLSGLFLGYQLLTIYYMRFIGQWALEHSNFVDENRDVDYYFAHSPYIVHASILLIMIYTLSYMKRVKYTNFILSTNSQLHSQMLNVIARTKVLFFDVNPIGRILNRFSNDLGILDKPNISASYDLIDGMLYNLSLLLTVCLINPLLFIPAIFIVGLLYAFRQYFAKSMILTKKLDLNSRSPIFSTISSTLGGLTIIRVYNQGERFIRNFLDLIYLNTKAYLFFFKTSRLFTMALDASLRGLMIIGVMTLSLLAFYSNYEPALFGLSFMFLLQIAEETCYIIRQTLAVDINMQSTQRMLEYCRLEQEAPENIPTTDSIVKNQFNNKWPSRGNITFQNVYLKYRPELNCALNGLSFSIPGGTKVACVGRTGAGKSSIIQALFRMVEIEDNYGNDNPSYIKIDGVDIRSIGLHLLRSHLSIIPQTPVVFTGTIRRNLDPFEEHTVNEIWEVLEELSLKNHVKALENQLETDMTVSSSVFSTGQKQLICLARAILMKSKVLILDEATANVDMETDEFIQRKIMEKFSECTVVTIAHRLITIANYDKVIVMDRGRMVEFGSPYELLVENVGDDRISKLDGVFADMVKSTGVSMSEKIFKVARECYYGNI